MGERAAVTIRRQVLEVDLHGTEAEGHALQERLPRVCREVLPPAIESALGPLDTADTRYYIDRLALDVTLTSLDGFEAELAEAVRREIADHVRRHWRSRDGTTVALGDPDDGRDGRRRARTQPADDVLVAFLRTGRLPWWFRLPPGRTLEEFVLDAWREVGGARAGASAATPLRTVLAVPEARERLVSQFTPRFTLTVLRALSSELATLVRQVEVALGATVRRSSAGRAFRRRVHQVALEAAAARAARTESGTEALARRAWSMTGPADRADGALAAALERAWPGSTGRAAAPDPNVAARPSPVPAPRQAMPGPPQVMPTPPRAAPTPPQRMPVPPRADHAVLGGDESVERDGLLVDHAGIVLLHPFLPRFLAGVGVAAGNELVDPSRALCLLHHLATGDLVAPEHQLTLAKALCGVPFAAPCEADVGLTDAETIEATALLEAAIGHWEALRSTSVGGLRAEFLQRAGVLSVTTDGDWRLRVEARTVDILLDQLPWGFSSFRLPWMSRLMMVEWR